MFLHRIHLDPRSREARRDLADPYQLHATLCRAFSPPDQKCPEGEILWRLEPEASSDSCPRVLVQSRTIPDWAGIGVKGWLAKADPPVDLKDRLKLDALMIDQRFRFRLRANPCVTRNGKRLGLLQLAEQEQWIKRKGLLHGFLLPQLPSFDLSETEQERIDIRVSQEQMLKWYTTSWKRDPCLLSFVRWCHDSDRCRGVREGVAHGYRTWQSLRAWAPVCGTDSMT